MALIQAEFNTNIDMIDAVLCDRWRRVREFQWLCVQHLSWLAGESYDSFCELNQIFRASQGGLKVF